MSEIDGRTIIHHGGDAVVMGSWTMIDTLTKTAASLLYNGPNLDPYRYPSKIWVVNNLLHIAAGQPLTESGRPRETDPTRNDFDLPIDRFDRYIGSYLSAEGQRFTITKAPAGDRLLFAMTAGWIKYAHEIDFVTEASAVLRNISGGVVVSFLVTPNGQITGLTGGLPGGTFRKRSDAELTKIQELRSPSGRMLIQLPKGWSIAWTGDSFEAHDSADTASVIRGSIGAGTVVEPTPPVSSARSRSETVGRFEWGEWWWTGGEGEGEGEGEGRRQRMTATRAEGGTVIRLSASTRAGGMTVLVHDALVPLMTSLEVGPTAR